MRVAASATALLAVASMVATLPAGQAAHAADAASVPHPAATLVERGSIAMRSDPDASRRDAEAALGLLRTRPDADLEIRARLLLCDYQSERDQAAMEKQVAAIEALLPRARRPGLRTGLLSCQGEMRETLGDNAQALAFFEQAVRVASDARDDEMIANALYSRGYVLGLQGEYALGLADLRRAQGLYETLDKPAHALTAMNGIAILYNRMGDYAQARDIYTSALALQREAKMLREQAVTLHNLGRAHEYLGEWPEARRSFTESLAINREIHYGRGEAYALRGLAAVENGLGNWRGALDLLGQASALLRSTPDARLRAQIDLARGIALHGTGELDASVAALRDAIEVFRKGEARGELAAGYAELAAVEAARGDWRSGYTQLALAKQVNERLLRNQIDQRFATLRVEFDTASKEAENALLQRDIRENERALAQSRSVRRLQAVAIALAALLVALLATLAMHQRRTTRRMRTLAHTDELTAAPNRRAVLGRLAVILTAEGAGPCSTLITDIDHFKGINDRYGHPVGDEVLKIVAQALRDALREPAFFGRLGGEEFLVVLPETVLDEGRATAERVRQSIEAIDLSHICPVGRRITVSVGVTASVPGDSPSSMLQRADEALYAAKRAGRNAVRVLARVSATSATGAHGTSHDAVDQTRGDNLQDAARPTA
ncbi:MAG: diguanylate cyclase [Steroidobacteraceae bacterium]